jgi:hypothetical protein
MSLSPAIELKNCIARHPEDDTKPIRGRIQFSIFVRMGLPGDQDRATRVAESIIAVVRRLATNHT